MIWNEIFPENLFVSALIAGGLYFLSYLSFVRMLRHWRNWHPPTLSSSLVTAGLALAMVIHVSFTGSGFNLLALILVTGFIIFLFGIIAAPAIAFQPGPPRPVVEFFAKYAEYTGLWMIPAAILVGFVLPDPSLMGLLVTAVALELTWFIRSRGTSRKSYPLDAGDLLVLQTQASGNVAGFAKQHSISELQISPDGDANWLGCSKNSLPCPLNHYLHRLGLNTPPCCREHIADLGRFVTDCLQDIRATHWIDGGTLLGAVRENGALLAWEDDIDISVLLDDETTWKKLCSTLSQRGASDGYYVDVFEKSGFIAVSYDKPLLWPFRWVRNRMRGDIHLDLVTYRHATNNGQPVVERQLLKGAMPAMESGWHGVPIHIILPTSTIKFLGSDIPCPSHSRAFLQILYGDFQTVELTYVDENAAKVRADIDKVSDVSAPRSN
jgi:multisubunit Na+/H+ antiporter MnhG subunit